MNLAKTLETTKNWSLAAALALSSAALSLPSFAADIPDMPGGPKRFQLDLQEPATLIAHDQRWIHYFVMWICVAIFIAVFGVMFYSIWKHRKSKGAKSATFHESTAVEIAWTVIPFLIVIGMALPATRMVVEQKDTSSADLTVKVTGYQWKWGYEYVKGEGEGISFLSTLSTPRDQISGTAPRSPTYLMEVDNPLVVPVNKKVRIVLTAADVIHAWMIPAFGVKQDAIPGFIRDTWFKSEKVGTFRGQCAELCGKEHAFMPIVVEVKSAEDYAKWAAEESKKAMAKRDDPSKEWKMAELMARGQEVYAKNCVACHQATGKGLPPTFPALDGSAVVNGLYAGQLKTLLNGVMREGKQTAMASFASLSDTELAAVMTYTRNTWGNKTGEVVQPKWFVDARKGEFQAGGGSGGAAPAAEAPKAAAPVAASADLPGKIYFASGKSALPAESKAVIDAVIAYVKSNADAKLDLSGYVDSTGNADQNKELAKQRALNVRDALKAAGIAEDKINMKKPEVLTGAADNKEARRVEITAAK
jgi:cytochrome c oxidase subunit II